MAGKRRFNPIRSHDAQALADYWRDAGYQVLEDHTDRLRGALWIAAKTPEADYAVVGQIARKFDAIFRWSEKRHAWYWFPEDDTKRNRRRLGRFIAGEIYFTRREADTT